MKSDVDLMLEFQLGDKEAFEKLVLRHQIGLFNFFYRMVSDRQVAEDLTQEVFLKLYLHADHYMQTAKFTTYLYRIAKNSWIDHVRKSARRGSTLSLDKTFDDGKSMYDRLDAGGEMPEARLAQEDRSRIVHEAIESLPEEQRVVFVLSEVQEMKYNEIAETLGIPIGTVKSRMHVATHRLREILQQRGIVQP